MMCDICGDRATVIAPGGDEERAPGGILIRVAVPARQWCLACAIRAGWPWLRSERGQPDMFSGDVA